MILDLKPNIGKRAIASIIDYTLTFIVFNIYLIKFGEYDPIKNVHQTEGLMTLPIIVYWFIYHVLIEYLTGATLGHYIFRLKVFSSDGYKISIMQNIKRHLADCVDFMFFGIPAIISVKNSENYQRLGDLWAKTVVTKKEIRLLRNFYYRPIDEQKEIIKNVRCEKCQQNNLNLENIIEFSVSDKIFVKGLCNKCGKEIISEINK